MTMGLSVVPARLEEMPAVENLFQLYIHDFSEFWSGTPTGELSDEGRFAPPPLDAYWRSADHQPLLIRVAGHLAGFALINKEAHSKTNTDFNMAEFFVARKHRGTGVGRRAAQEIFGERRGLWEVAVARRNVGAISFWRGTIATLPGVHDFSHQDRRDEHWNGPIFRFSTAA